MIPCTSFTSAPVNKGSQLKEDEHGLKFRPKFRDMNYDWDKEIHPNWKSISPDIDFWKLLSESFIASFQLEEIDFYEGVENPHDPWFV